MLKMSSILQDCYKINIDKTAYVCYNLITPLKGRRFYYWGTNESKKIQRKQIKKCRFWVSFCCGWSFGWIFWRSNGFHAGLC